MSELLVGGNAFKAMLSGISPEERIPNLVNDVKNTKSVSKRDNLIKQIKYLDGLKRTGLSATDAYVIHHIPIIPPEMRPASVRSGNRIEFADYNILGRDAMLLNNSLKDIVDVLPPEELIKERQDNYNGVKALIGLGEAVSPTAKGRGVQGLLKQISGTTGPKTGLFHSKILSKKLDFSGRGTIHAGPELGFNEASVPADQLWVMYKFHILRDLAKQGYDYVNSEKAWGTRSPAATKSFNKVISTIPLIINRAPTLMKSNISAIYPIPSKDNSIGVNILHLPNFAADFDGDNFSLHVPMTSEAISEARGKLLMQNQIHDYRKGLNQSMMAPAHEAILGSIHMTEPDEKQEVITFKTEEECLAALMAGTIKENTPVKITG